MHRSRRARSRRGHRGRARPCHRRRGAPRGRQRAPAGRGAAPARGPARVARAHRRDRRRRAAAARARSPRRRAAAPARTRPTSCGSLARRRAGRGARRRARQRARRRAATPRSRTCASSPTGSTRRSWPRPASGRRSATLADTAPMPGRARASHRRASPQRPSRRAAYLVAVEAIEDAPAAARRTSACQRVAAARSSSSRSTTTATPRRRAAATLADRVGALGGRLERRAGTAAGGDPMRVVVADDVMLTREGIVRLLDDAGFEVVGEADDADGAAAPGPPRPRPDAAIVDIRMPPTHTDEGLVAAQRIRAEHPDDRRARALALRRAELRAAPARGAPRARRLPAQGARLRRRDPRRRAAPASPTARP